MTLEGLKISPELRDELDALIETGLYIDEETILTDAVRTFLAARPDLREAVACRLFERGIFSLGRAAEWSGLAIESIKRALHRRGIARAAPEGLAETEAIARETLKASGRTGA